MKRLIAATIALTLMSGTAAMADGYRHEDNTGAVVAAGVGLATLAVMASQNEDSGGYYIQTGYGYDRDNGYGYADRGYDADHTYYRRDDGDYRWNNRERGYYRPYDGDRNSYRQYYGDHSYYYNRGDDHRDRHEDDE